MATGIASYLLLALAIRQVKGILTFPEILMVRTAGGLLIALALSFLDRDVWRDLATIRPLDHLKRNALHACGSLCITFSLALLPLGLVASIDFTGPLFAAAIGIITISAWPKDKSWMGLGLIFSGALTIIIAHQSSMGLSIIVPFIGVAILTQTNIMLGALSSRHKTVTVLLVMNAMQLPIFIGLAQLWPYIPSLGTPPAAPPTLLPQNSLTFLIAILALAFSGFMTQTSLSNATRYGTPLQVSALDTLRIPTLAIAGALLFSETLDEALLAPGMVIMVGAIMVAFFEKRHGRSVPTGESKEA